VYNITAVKKSLTCNCVVRHCALIFDRSYCHRQIAIDKFSDRQIFEEIRHSYFDNKSKLYTRLFHSWILPTNEKSICCKNKFHECMNAKRLTWLVINEFREGGGGCREVFSHACNFSQCQPRSQEGSEQRL
jgi:hypothetical protein